MISSLEIAKTYKVYDGTSGTYVSVVPTDESCRVLQHWSSAFQLDNAKPEDSLHCTVTWSKAAVGSSSGMCDPDQLFYAELDHFEWWSGHDKDGYLTAVLKSPGLAERNQAWAQRGAVHSFDPYLPHVTLASKLGLTDTLSQRMKELTYMYGGFPLWFHNETIENAK